MQIESTAPRRLKWKECQTAKGAVWYGLSPTGLVALIESGGRGGRKGPRRARTHFWYRGVSNYVFCMGAAKLTANELYAHEQEIP